MKIKQGRFGLRENPVGLFVSCRIGERVYLGEVNACRWNDVRGCAILTVHHFNGEAWPFEPVASAVDIIAQNESEYTVAREALAMGFSDEASKLLGQFNRLTQ